MLRYSRKKKTIIDASSAILLYKSGLFDFLTQAYDTIMSESVYDEITCKGYPGAQTFERLYWANSFSVNRSEHEDKRNRKHWPGPLPGGRGELDTILKYLEDEVDFIIIDNGQGSSYCRSHYLPYINALLVPQILYFARYLSESEYHKKTAEIIRIGRYSPEIIDLALCCSRRELEYFLP